MAQHFLTVVFLSLLEIHSDERPKTVILTPETMAAHGFSITCRVSDAPNDRERKKAGPFAVHISFDAEKGPAVAKISFMLLIIHEADTTLVSVPLQMASGSSPKVHRYVRLLIDKDTLPKAQLALIPMGFDPPPSHFVNLAAFARPRAKLKPGRLKNPRRTTRIGEIPVISYGF